MIFVDREVLKKGVLVLIKIIFKIIKITKCNRVIIRRKNIIEIVILDRGAGRERENMRNLIVIKIIFQRIKPISY